MRILVKAAHTFMHPYCMARRIDPALEIISPKSLLMPNIIWPPIHVNGRPQQEVVPPRRESKKDYVVEKCELKIKDHEIVSCTPLMQLKDHEIVSYTPPMQGFRHETIRRSVQLEVKSTLTIGSLKSSLKPHPWIPKTNLVLVQREETPLEYDNLTLDECGIKDLDTLLACMGGSFPIELYYQNHGKRYLIPISSCFETVGDVKDKISQLVDCPREAQRLPSLGDKDETRLVTLGIVRPYLGEIFNNLGLTTPARFGRSVYDMLTQPWARTHNASSSRAEIS